MSRYAYYELDYDYPPPPRIRTGASSYYTPTDLHHRPNYTTDPYYTPVVRSRSRMLVFPSVPKGKSPVLRADIIFVAPGLGRGQSYHHAIPRVAHQRLSGVSAPPQGFKPIGPQYYTSYSYAAAADPEMHVVVPRKTASAFLSELEEDEGPRMTVIEEQIGRMKRDARALGDQLTSYKPKVFPSPKITPEEVPKTDFLSNAFAFYYDDCVRNRLPRRKPGSLEVYPSALRPLDSVINDINTMSYYNKHQSVLGVGPVGKLSCVSYANRHPITKRHVRYPPEDFADLNADILNISLYPRINRSIGYGGSYGDREPSRVLACGTRLPPPLPRIFPHASQKDAEGPTQSVSSVPTSKWRNIEKEISPPAPVARRPPPDLSSIGLEEKPAKKAAAVADQESEEPAWEDTREPTPPPPKEPTPPPPKEPTPPPPKEPTPPPPKEPTPPPPKEPTPPPPKEPTPPPPKEPTPPPPREPTPPPPKEPTPPPPKEPTPPPPKEPTPPPKEPTPPPKEPTPPPAEEPTPEPVLEEPAVVEEAAPAVESEPVAADEPASVEPDADVAEEAPAAAMEEETAAEAAPAPTADSAEEGEAAPAPADSATGKSTDESIVPSEEPAGADAEEAAASAEEPEEEAWEMPDEEFIPRKPLPHLQPSTSIEPEEPETSAADEPAADVSETPAPNDEESAEEPVPAAAQEPEPAAPEGEGEYDDSAGMDGWGDPDE